MSDKIGEMVKAIQDREEALRKKLEDRNLRWDMVWNHVTTKALTGELDVESQTRAYMLTMILFYMKHGERDPHVISWIDELIS